MAKVTITLEDVEGGMTSNLNMLDPGRDYATIEVNPTMAEACGIIMVEMLKQMGATVGRIIDDAEYHAKDERNG